MNKSTSRGFTLIEILVTSAIFLMFMAVATNFVLTGFRSTRFGYEQDDAVQNARRFVNNFNQSIREATYSQTGDYIIITAEDQTLVFYSNIDADPDIERVRYFVEDNILKQGVIKPSGPPLTYDPLSEQTNIITRYINNGTDPIFTYFNNSNEIISDPNANIQAIRLVKVFLKINVTPTVAPNDFIIETGVQIRNLKDNL